MRASEMKPGTRKFKLAGAPAKRLLMGSLIFHGVFMHSREASLGATRGRSPRLHNQRGYHRWRKFRGKTKHNRCPHSSRGGDEHPSEQKYGEESRGHESQLPCRGGGGPSHSLPHHPGICHTRTNNESKTTAGFLLTHHTVVSILVLRYAVVYRFG